MRVYAARHHEAMLSIDNCLGRKDGLQALPDGENLAITDDNVLTGVDVGRSHLME